MSVLKASHKLKRCTRVLVTQKPAAHRDCGAWAAGGVRSRLAGLQQGVSYSIWKLSWASEARTWMRQSRWKGTLHGSCCLPSNAEHSVGLTTHPLPYPVVLSLTNQCKEGPTGMLLSQLSVFACGPPPPPGSPLIFTRLFFCLTPTPKQGVGPPLGSNRHYCFPIRVQLTLGFIFVASSLGFPESGAHS